MRIEPGQVAVVTGGGSGIGRALARALAERGTHVVAADVADDDVNETVRLVTAAGGSAESTRCDVSDGAAVEALAASVMANHHRIDVVCNNAGVSTGGPIWEATEADWRFVLGVNLWGVVHGVRAFVPRLIEQGSGHVVNTASLAGLIAAPGLGVYTASKHAVVGISETLYRDLRDAGSPVGVSVLCPGFVNTRIWDGGRSRPSDLANPISPADAEAQAAIAEIAAAFFDTAMSPDLVAAQVCDAVEDDRFWVLTHPELTPGVVDRVTGLAEGRNPGDLNPLLG